jgi:hypothetical protein
MNNYKEIVDNLFFPVSWKNEGVEEPSYICKDVTEIVLRQIETIYKLKSDAIVSSIEGGIMIKYYKGDVSFLIEVSNDGEIAALINKDREIIESFDIENLDFNKAVSMYLELN